jgi:hypothetical protein
VEVTNVQIPFMCRSSFSMLAIGTIGACVVSNCVALITAVPHYWLDDEWFVYLPCRAYFAAGENFAWASSKIEKTFSLGCFLNCSVAIRRIFW